MGLEDTLLTIQVVVYVLTACSCTRSRVSSGDYGGCSLCGVHCAMFTVLMECTLERVRLGWVGVRGEN